MLFTDLYSEIVNKIDISHKFNTNYLLTSEEIIDLRETPDVKFLSSKFENEIGPYEQKNQLKVYYNLKNQIYLLTYQFAK